MTQNPFSKPFKSNENLSEKFRQELIKLNYFHRTSTVAKSAVFDYKLICFQNNNFSCQSKYKISLSLRLTLNLSSAYIELLLSYASENDRG